MKRLITIFGLTIFGLSKLFAQSTTGTDFWLSFMQNFDTPVSTQIYITSDVGATGTVSIPGSGWSVNFTIGANGSQYIEVPAAQNACISQPNTVLNRAVRVQSDTPVAVYAANQRTASSDATIVFPTIALGDNYLVTTYSHFSSQPSEFIVVGIEDGTSIEITPKANLSGGGGNANIPFSITLNAGEVYLVQSLGDLTGSTVKSTELGNCHNFAVFAGNTCANVPLSCTYCDHLYEQMIPVKAWGNNYITVPLMTRASDTYRILACEDATIVNINGGANINLNAGQFHEVNLSTTSFITSDKPISVAQYSQGTSCDGVTSDPFMIMLSPIEQTLDYIVFQAFNTTAINQFYTNIVAKTSTTSEVLLDGSPLTGWATVPANNAYSYVRKNLTQGSHYIISPEGVLATVYGFGDVESYGYLAGANIVPLNVSFDIVVDGTSTAFDVFQDTLMCTQTTVSFQATSTDITNVEWDLGDGSPIVVGNQVINHEYPAVTDTYTVTMYFLREGACVQEHISMEVNINSNLPPITELNDTIVCNGDPFTITLNDPGITYQWQDNSISNSYTFANTGTYSVTATDAVGCSASSTCFVEFINLSVGILTQDVTCNNMNDGEISANVFGGHQPYQYIWNTNPQQTTQSLTNLEPGEYSVTVTENSGCSATATGTIANQPSLVVNVTNIQGILCYGDSNGTARVNVVGGTEPYTIAWNPDNITGFEQTTLVAGDYQFTVTDNNGCTGEAEFTINDVTPLSYVANTQDVDCYGNQTGRIEFNASGGTGSLTYNWSNGLMTSSLNNIVAGEYIVTVTDYNNCSLSAEFEITQPDELELHIYPTNIDCYGNNNGSILLNVVGGTTPYSFNWNSGQTSQNLENLIFGTYIVTVGDANGCSSFGYAILEQPQLPLHGNITPTHVRCFGEGNGVADLTVVGGTEPYYYSWNTGAISEDIDNLIPGTYMVTITDHNNCTHADTVQIIQPSAPLSGTISGTHVSCQGNTNDGNVYITAQGGRPPYHFEWSNGSWEQNLIGVGVGIYSVTISDQSGCHHVMEYEITEPEPFYLQAMDDQVICYGMTTEIGIGIITGGVAPYTIVWDNDDQGMTTLVSPTETTTYSAHVVDAGFCVSQDIEITVYVHKPLELNVSVSNNIVCPGSQVTCTATVSGGGLTNNNVWVNDSLMSNPIRLTIYNDTVFRFRVQDVCGFAEVTKDIHISTYELPLINPRADRYSGCSPLEVNFEETSPDQGQRYVWNFDDGDFENLSFAKNPTHIFENARTYSVNLTIFSKNNCAVDSTIGITVFPVPEVDFRADRESVSTEFPLVNFSNYSVGAFWYHWDFGDGNTSKDRNPSHTYSAPGTYTVTLEAESLYSCSDTAQKIIVVNTEHTIYAPTAFTPNYDGMNDKFRVFVANANTKEWRFIVYNRWGEIVFNTEDYEQEWDGRYNDMECPVGVYTWYVQYKDLYGNDYSETGYFTLIR
jgi:gliding motility-associated-like protein